MAFPMVCGGGDFGVLVVGIRPVQVSGKGVAIVFPDIEKNELRAKGNVVRGQ